MAVSVMCPQLADQKLRTQLSESVSAIVKRWRPSFENWRLSLFKSQAGDGWDLAMSGPRFRKVFTLHGPVEDLPGLVAAYIDAIFAHTIPG
jgi:hypothetical protein